MFRFIVALGLLAAQVCSQSVTVANLGLSPYDGWVRTTIDQTPTHPVGMVGNTLYVLGRQIGSARVVDLKVVGLAGNSERVLDLSTATPSTFTLGGLGTDRGWPAIGGTAMVPAADWLRADGACYLIHLKARLTSMLHADLWIHHYPDQPWATGELVLTSSNVSVPDLSATIPSSFTLTCGDAIVVVPGLPWNSPLLPAGETLGDGQARSWPVVFGWPTQMTGTQPVAAQAQADFRIVARGVKLHPLGLPQVPASFSTQQWMNENLIAAASRLHTWQEGLLGVSANSSQTGAQEDQGFMAGIEAGLSGGMGAIPIRYWTALGQSRRPMHHLEADGSQLNLDGHPQLVLWSSRPHWRTDVSPDRLNKPREVTQAETKGWNGPDREHWLVNTLAMAARVTGSPALQWQLEAHARVFLFGETINPALSTSSTDVARSAGYAGMLVTYLWENLENRTLANRVADRWRARVQQIYIPVWGSTAGNIWGTSNDYRLTSILTGYPLAWMPYQQALGAYGMYLACSTVGPVEGVAFAAAGARAVVQHAFQDTPTGPVEWEILGYNGGAVLAPSQYVEGIGAHRTGWFRHEWLPLGVWVAARDGDQRAVSIYNTLISEALLGNRPLKWFPPL